MTFLRSGDVERADGRPPSRCRRSVRERARVAFRTIVLENLPRCVRSLPISPRPSLSFSLLPPSIVIPVSPTPDFSARWSRRTPFAPLFSPSMGGPQGPRRRANYQSRVIVRTRDRVGSRQRGWPSIIQAIRPCVLGASGGADWLFKRASKSDVSYAAVGLLCAFATHRCLSSCFFFFFFFSFTCQFPVDSEETGGKGSKSRVFIFVRRI